MTVTDLISRLSQCPPDAVVVVPSSDHSYRVASLYRATAESVGRNRLVEYYDSASDQANPVVPVVVLV